MHTNAVIILHDIACRLGRGGCVAPGGFMRVAGFGGEASAPRRHLGGRGPASGIGPRTDMNTVFIRPDGSDRPGLPDIPGPSLARASMTLDMDETGRISKRVLTMGPEARTHEYEYDDSGRLTRVKEDGQDTEIYEYCDLGRRIASTSIPRAVHGRQYEYDAEGRLTKAGKTSYEYDAYGNLAAKREGPHGMLETRYYHTPRGELLRVELPRQQGGKTIDYQLDPQGRRAAKAIDGKVTERYQWLDRLRLKAVLDAQGNPKAIFLYDRSGSRLPIGMRTELGDLRFFQDQVGTLVAIMDKNENILTTLEHDSFGNRLGESDHRITPYLGFCSGLHDRDTNLVLFGYRNYDPDVGRFITPDPLGYTGGDPGDMYEYCVDDPIHASDRTGLWGDSLFGGKKSQGDNLVKGTFGSVGAAANKIASIGKTVNSVGHVDGPRQWMSRISGAVKSAADYANPIQWSQGAGSASRDASELVNLTRHVAKGIQGAITPSWNTKIQFPETTKLAMDFRDSDREKLCQKRGIKVARIGLEIGKALDVPYYAKAPYTLDMAVRGYEQGYDQQARRFKLGDWVLKEKNKGTDWVKQLPGCPCEFPGENDPDWVVSNWGIGSFHPGASNCVRSVVKWGQRFHGQQCCYDENGKLITGGKGAGTPDKVSPAMDLEGHINEDVTFSVISRKTGDPESYKLYNSVRPPNNSFGCKENIR